MSASTRNQALGALLFLYKEVFGRDLSRFDAIVRARRPVRLPVVLSREEVVSVLGRLRGTPWLMASLLYGSGLRLVECCQLRVKDLDLGRRRITVRDVRRGAGSVALPDALRRKYPNAAREWAWRWVFPATRFHVDPESHERRRHHLHESVLQRAVRTAVREAGLTKPGSCHTLRHPNHPGTPRAPRREHHDGLHTRPRSRWPRSPGPTGVTVMGRWKQWRTDCSLPSRRGISRYAARSRRITPRPAVDGGRQVAASPSETAGVWN